MFRAMFFGSSVLSVTIVTLVWRLVYLPDRGLLSDLLSVFGIGSIDMVTSETLGPAGDRDGHGLVDHRPADDAVPGRRCSRSRRSCTRRRRSTTPAAGAR